MDVGKPLDVDSELTTVGWSNVVSGLCGGFTGSYIFSQTIFTCRSGCHSKGVGMLFFFLHTSKKNKHILYCLYAFLYKLLC